MRRAGGGRFPGGILPAALGLWVIAIFAAGPALALEARAADLSPEHRQAIARFDTLLERPDRARRPALWDAAEQRFRAILNTDPDGVHANEAAFMIGEVNYQRHRLFRERRHLDAAIAAYRRVLTSYRFGSRSGDALVRLADIHYYDLDDSRRAYLLYRKATRDYPDTGASRRARVRMIGLKARFPQYAALGEAAIDPIAAPPRSGKLLPSPGAVLGGGGDARGGPNTPKPATDLPGSLPDRAAAPLQADALHPLLEEGPIPLRSPSEDLPPLRSLRPRS